MHGQYARHRSVANFGGLNPTFAVISRLLVLMVGHASLAQGFDPFWNFDYDDMRRLFHQFISI